MLNRCLRIVCVFVFLSSAVTLLSAQDSTDKSSSKGSSTTVTGCIQKGTEANGYYLTDESGKTWELTNSAAKVSAHVGHKVTLAGTSTKLSKTTESKKEPEEKKEAGSNTSAGDFKVTSVKMISDSCGQ
jgi:hypothetical protein